MTHKISDETRRKVAEAIHDANRYRRLRVLGCAPDTSKHLDDGRVLRFTNLDEFVDEDMRHYRRGEIIIDESALLDSGEVVVKESKQQTNKKDMEQL